MGDRPVHAEPSSTKQRRVGVGIDRRAPTRAVVSRTTDRKELGRQRQVLESQRVVKNVRANPQVSIGTKVGTVRYVAALVLWLTQP